MRPLTGAVGGAVAAACFAAGCGGPLSQEEFVAKANAICARAETAANAVPAPTRRDDPRAAAAYFDRVIPIARREFAELRALEPPAQRTRAFQAYLASGDRGVRLLERASAAAGSGDAERARALLGQLENLTNDSDEQARRLGLTSCAGG